MWVRPLLIVRPANCVPAIAGALLLAVAGTEFDGVSAVIVVGIAAVVAIVLLPRAFRMGVYVEGGSATVHGQFRDRTIRRDQVLDVYDTGTIVWRDDSGHRRRSFVVVLNGGHRAVAPIRRHNAQCINQLRRWAGLKGQAPPGVGW